MSSVSVVKFRFSEGSQELDTLLTEVCSERGFSLDVENSPIPQEVATILAFNSGGLLLACIKNKQDLADLMMFLKRDSKILSGFKWKCLVFEDFQPRMLKHALEPLGVNDIFPLKFNAAVVKLRIDQFLKSLLPEESSVSSVVESAPGVGWSDPLNLEADIWLLEDLSHCRKVLSTWVISLQGPSTQIGTWTKAAPRTWAFKINANEREIFGVGGGRWLVEAVAMPKLDWKEKRWVIQGHDIQLYYQNGEERFYKIHSQEGALHVAKDSLHAQMKRDLILDSYNDKFIFKVLEKTAASPEVEIEKPLGDLLELNLVPVKEKIPKSAKLKPPFSKSFKIKKPLVQKKEKLATRQQMVRKQKEKKTNASGKKENLRPKPLPLIKTQEEMDAILELLEVSFEEITDSEESPMPRDPVLEATFQRALEEERKHNTEAAIEAHLECLAVDELFHESLEHLFFLYDSLHRYEEAYDIGCTITYNFPLKEKISCRVIHLIFVLQVYDDILPLSVRMLSGRNPDAKIYEHVGTGLFLIGRNYLDQGDELQGLTCFDLIATHNDLLCRHVKYVVLSLLEMNRRDEAQVYLEFVENQTDRLICSKAGQLGLIKDAGEFIQDAKKIISEFTDNALKKFLLSKLQLFGFSEEDAIQQLES